MPKSLSAASQAKKVTANAPAPGIGKLTSLDKSNAILDAAALVFMELGFATASVDDISAAYGATKGIIYYHFKNKSTLFFAVQRRAMEMTRAAIEPHALSDDAPSRKLYKMAHAHTLLIMQQLSYLRVAAQGLELHLSGRTNTKERSELKAITDLRDSNEMMYVQVIDEGIQNGEFQNVDPKLWVKPLLGALNWTSRWYRPRPHESDTDQDRIAHELASFALQAFRQ
ncbi:TetR/AcrR family transcriptional regulator [Alcaligenaceae bacterium]|nr:TetR/AcrR family transcriptional regulator [Alcaligenaceae bacterium]